MTRARVWLLSLCLAVVAVLLAAALLTHDERLIGLANSEISRTSDFRFAASSASWSVRSPLEISFFEPRFVHKATPERSLLLDSLQIGFTLHPYPSLSRLVFATEQLPAQAVMAYFGAPFKLSANLAVRGDFSLIGTAAGTLEIRGGSGTLDTRGLDRLNRGPVRWARDSGHFVDWPELMSFHSLEAEFDASRGFDKSRFELALENLNLRGSGELDLKAERIDYAFELHLSSKDDRTGFRAGELVANVPWPIRCQGSFAENLPCRPDYAALQDLARRLIEQDAEDAFSQTFGEIGQRLLQEL